MIRRFHPRPGAYRPNLESEQLLADRIPARFAAGSKVSRSMISAGCVIEGEVVNSVLSPGVKVGRAAGYGIPSSCMTASLKKAQPLTWR